ncbi:Cell division cycle-related protein res2/pct1 [Penicillium ucsense]|uniref:Cell pattern formation-associated protein stuA n=1 Tax=Penicillium ucsense TaxID=2839758 RepID=A0A8J8VZ27_9EURO|nr:Cell division cycle-related protein res2/pct1 [Penicillium ucsense]KAF7733635.1 Cell division cycle-related protein res2/pct1 [Penicillium ucsense]
MAEQVPIYSATYSSVPVYELKIAGESVMRRRADDWVNATHILKAAGFDKPARTRILERDVQKGVHEKIQGGYGKYQGTWIPLADGRTLAERHLVYAKIAPIFEYVAGDRSPPPAPKHTTASSKPRAPRKSTNRTTAPTENFKSTQPQRSMPPPSLPHDHDDMNITFDDNESIEQATIDSSSMMADEDSLQPSQHESRKRKRVEGYTVLSETDKAHIIYGDQLLDYFVFKADASYSEVARPNPPPNFQVDRPIDSYNNTALHWACSMGDLEIIQDLLRRGANASAVSSHDETPLIRAVLFVNNYEKRTFPAVLDMLMDTAVFRDWFGATLFHHIAQTTKSKGKWKSAKYYCEVTLHKLRKVCSQEDIELLLCCQDNNGDTAVLVAARNGASKVANMLLAHCPRAGDLVNKRGETASRIMYEIAANAHQPDHDIPPAPSSVTMANEQPDGPGADQMPSDNASIGTLVNPALTTELLPKIGAMVSEAHSQLTSTYGNANVNEQASDDVAKPEALYGQLESDRERIKRRIAVLMAKEAKQEDYESQHSRFERVRVHFESLHEHRQLLFISDYVEKFCQQLREDLIVPTHISEEVLAERVELVCRLATEAVERHSAVKNLAQQTADAGVSTKFDVHRKLVALATDLKEEDLDPMAADLAEFLEFDRANGEASPVGSEDKIIPPETH